MKRNAFIKNMLLLFGATVLPNGLQAMVHQYDRIYLLQSFVRGFQYYNGKKLLVNMNAGDIVELVREPANEYDDFAIAIHYQGSKIGFVPAESNEILAKIIDANLLKLQAEITHIKPNTQAWENTAIAIYVLRTNNNTLPEHAKYLLSLDKPYYRTIKTKQYFICYDDELFEEEEMIDTIEINHKKGEILYELLEQKSKDDGIYGDIHNHFTAEQLAIVANENRVLININKLPKNINIENIAYYLDNEVANLNNFFKEDGYIIANMDALAKMPNCITNVISILDNSTNQFMEIILG